MSRLDDAQRAGRPWDGSEAYAETKLHDVLLAFGVARRWPEVAVNAVTPGWVPTRMGGPEAPHDLAQAHLTQAWLATSDDPAALASGRYLHHMAPGDLNPAAGDEASQDRLLDLCREASGVALP